MSMTRKHFQAVASSLNTCRFLAVDTGTEFLVDAVARELATTFQEINPWFDRAKFLAACGLAPAHNNKGTP